jgi:TfoX/Sxy family transcriptional regulator of competence genes
MKFEKAPASLVATFDRALARSGGERRQMFGYPCAFEAGQMFCGIFGPTIVVRLAEAEREAFLAKGARPFEPMPGRRMKEYVVLPAAVVGDDAKLTRWFETARGYAKTLPPKKKAARKAAGGRKRRDG